MFPPVDEADDDGLLCIGGQLNLATLRAAYSRGIFPWPVEGYPLLWFAPPRRAILRFDELTIPRSWHKMVRRMNFEIRVDCNFDAVIAACATRKYCEGTWITAEMEKAYRAFHRAGFAHSVEAYLNGELAGGLYGVALGGYFAGESMFYHTSGASKAALMFLLEHLKARGATWLDTQMLTPLFETIGAREIPREEFMLLLQNALALPVRLFDEGAV